MDSFPDLTSLHGDPRFIAMVAEVKQRAAATKTPEIKVLNGTLKTVRPRQNHRGILATQTG